MVDLARLETSDIPVETLRARMEARRELYALRRFAALVVAATLALAVYVAVLVAVVWVASGR